VGNSKADDNPGAARANGQDGEAQRASGEGLDGRMADGTESAAETQERRAEAVERLGRSRWTVPEGYKFDREEANDRSAR
jgi:hypothetical protein